MASLMRKMMASLLRPKKVAILVSPKMTTSLIRPKKMAILVSTMTTSLRSPKTKKMIKARFRSQRAPCLAMCVRNWPPKRPKDLLPKMVNLMGPRMVASLMRPKKVAILVSPKMMASLLRPKKVAILVSPKMTTSLIRPKKDGDSGKHNDDKSKKPKDKKDDKSLIQVAKSSMLGNVRAQLATEEAEGSSPEDGSKPEPKDDGKPDEV